MCVSALIPVFNKHLLLLGGGSASYKPMNRVENLCLVVSLRTVATLTASSHFFPVVPSLRTVVEPRDVTRSG